MSTLNPATIQPQLIEELALYDLGHGIGHAGTVLLLPHPAEETKSQRARMRLALLLVRLGKRVISFDPPALVETDTLIGYALKALNVCLIDTPIDVVAEAAGNVLALALAQRHPERVERLVMVGTPPSAFNNISTPTLFYVNSKDTLGISRARSLVARLPNCRLEVDTQGGLCPYDTDPVHFGAVLHTFLAPISKLSPQPISVEL